MSGLKQSKFEETNRGENSISDYLQQDNYSKGYC